MSAHLGTGNVFVAEADESDATFVAFSPEIAVVTNLGADHLDFYGTQQAYTAVFDEFGARIHKGGALIVCADDPGAVALGGASQLPSRGTRSADASAGVGCHDAKVGAAPPARDFDEEASPGPLVQGGIDVIPAMWNQCCCERTWIGEIGHGRLQIDDRFREKAGYGGGADVLDASDQPGCEQRLEMDAFLLTAESPSSRP